MLALVVLVALAALLGWLGAYGLMAQRPATALVSMALVATLVVAPPAWGGGGGGGGGPSAYWRWFFPDHLGSGVLITNTPGDVIHRRVFEPFGDSVGVELDYRHPIALDSCTSLFAKESLTLFRADGEVEIVEPLPPFAPVHALVRSPIELDAELEGTGQGVHADLSMSLPLKLAPTTEPWRAVMAAVVPIAQRQWLSRLLYALPPRTLSSLRMAMGKDAIYLMDPAGIEGVPLGIYYSEVASRIYVPCGYTIVPGVAPTVLESLLTDRGDGHVFFDLAGTPRLVAGGAFGPVSQRALTSVASTPVDADTFEHEEPPLPLFNYDEARRFPLWGVPGKAVPDEDAPDKDVPDKDGGGEGTA